MELEIFEHPLLVRLHDQIMDLAHEWAKGPDNNFLRGHVSGFINAWNIALYELVEDKFKKSIYSNITLYKAREEIRNEYLSLINEGWGTKHS